jgi:multiple sugar transport system substrate-binding protein
MKRGVLLIVGIVFLVIFGVLVFLFARGGNKAVVSPVVKVWAPFDEKKVYDELTKPFLEANPGVSVEFKYIEAADAKEYEAKVVDAIASGTGPDVWLIRTDWLPKHASKLTIMPNGLGWTTNRKESDKEALERLLTPAVVAQNSFSGAIYGLPLSVDSLALYVGDNVVNDAMSEFIRLGDPRAEILRNNPRTWAELEAWVRALTVKNKNTVTRPAIALGTITNTYAATDVYSAMLQQFGGLVYNSPSEVALNLALGDGSLPAVRALELFKSFSDPAHPNYTWNETLGDPVALFAAEKLPMMIAYSSLQPELLRRNSSLSKVGVLPLPQVNEIVLPTDERTDFAAYWTHVVPKSATNQELAWRYLERLLTYENESYYSRMTLKPSYLGVDRAALADISAKNMGDLSVFTRQAFNAEPLLKTEWQFVDQTIQSMINSARTGLLSVQAAVDTAAQQLKDGQ